MALRGIHAVIGGLRRLSRPLFASACVAGLTASTAAAQDPVRPWRDWRTMTVDGYRFHHLAELEGWTRDVASRILAVDSALAANIGWPVPKPMDVVVDDPFAISNGYALPFIDKPVTVWWATPADPRNDIGNYRTWGELLSIHELAHIAHLTRPSRNPLRRALWASLPVNVGPITLTAPRWVYEGYATLIEGRISATGRPNNAWRPAILRQWAIEGRLPTYGQLANWGDFNGGGFAYLGGSAFLEWLTQVEGDSSLTYLWRRMTARRTRDFASAFRGVYGDTPQALYGRHAAELTYDAMKAGAILDGAGLVEGELVQRLTWATGDPAISPNGARVALTLRERDRPGRLVVWKTTPEPEDTAAIRRRIAELTRDPLDVPDRRFYPRVKQAEKTLLARNGRGFQMPRWFSDNRRVLATRWTARSDGTLSPALYIWDTESDDVHQATDAVGVLNADPHPKSQDAVAMQCHAGHCDIVHVDLARGAMRTLLEGTPDRTYYRPRYSPDGAWFAASVNDDGRWKVLIARANGSGVRFLDPGDGANRYDVQWLGSDTVVVVSERGGIPNLEKLAIERPVPITLTRVTGAAMAPELNRGDGSVWFLALHARGLDVRRLPADAPIADSVVRIVSGQVGFAGAGSARLVQLATNAVGPARSYGAGTRHQRWFPGGSATGDGLAAFASIYSGDIIGRLNLVATGSLGERAAPSGGSLRGVWRGTRPHVELGMHGVIHEPSLGPRAQPASVVADASLAHAVVATSVSQVGEWWQVHARAGGASGRLSPRNAPIRARHLGFVDVSFRMQQSRGARGLAEQFDLQADYGHTAAPYHRLRGTFTLNTLGRDLMPLQLQATFGRVLGAPHPYEQFIVGGAAPVVMDTSVRAQRYAMPMFPTGVAAGPSLFAWRAALPGTWTLFYEGASTAANVYSHRQWHRAIGAEMRYAFPGMPVAFLPRAAARGGVAYTLDAPFRRTVRAFFEMRFEP
ncbi:MAG TPA: hypothetical protein VEB19_00610 [Gemmatimonadaceae bacterium]|nr:hypothetical protein [Gemmatimonadaceae bacterium]